MPLSQNRHCSRTTHPFAQALTVAVMLAITLPAVAQQPTEPRRADVPPPPVYVGGPNDEKLEPVVTIRKDGDREVEEYRIRGKLFAMRVKVKGAPAYWLVDPDGSGRMVPGQNIGPSIAVPKWVLMEF